jgi:hypothetical protein
MGILVDLFVASSTIYRDTVLPSWLHVVTTSNLISAVVQACEVSFMPVRQRLFPAFPGLFAFAPGRAWVWNPTRDLANS